MQFMPKYQTMGLPTSTNLLITLRSSSLHQASRMSEVLEYSPFAKNWHRKYRPSNSDFSSRFMSNFLIIQGWKCLAGQIIEDLLYLGLAFDIKQLRMINQIVVSGACCCLQFCCKQIFETAYKIVGRIAFIKLMYMVVYFSFIVCVYLAMYLLRQWEFFMKMFAQGISCLAITEAFDCVSASVIYRICLSLFIFSIIMVIVLALASARIAKIVNQGLFFSKFVITFIIFMVTLQFSNNFITSFQSVAQVFSYVFIIWQIIIVIDLAYLWGIKWAEHYSEGNTLYGCLLITFSIINYCISIGINIYGYILSGSNDTEKGYCHNYPNVLSTIFIIGMFGVQLLNYNKQNSLLATSALSVFTSYWLLSAIFSSQSCNNSIIFESYNTVITKSTFLKINIPISFLFVLISSFGSIYGSSNQQKEDKFIELQENITIDHALKPEQLESLHRQKKMWIKYHLFMMAMSLYICMICTDWGSGDILNGKFQLTANAEISKVFNSCATFIIYVWTLIAPRVLPGRNFEFS